MRFEKILNKYLLPFIGVSLVVLIVLFLFWEYRKERNTIEENTKIFEVNENEDSPEESVFKPSEQNKSVNVPQIEGEIDLGNTNVSFVEKSFGIPISEGKIDEKYNIKTYMFNSQTTGNINIMSFYYDENGKIIAYTTIPENISLSGYLKENGLINPDFILIPNANYAFYDTEPTDLWVYLEKGLILGVSDTFEIIYKFKGLDKEEVKSLFGPKTIEK